MSTVYNFQTISALLACSGQPRESQLASIADEGFKVIFNLGLTDTKYSLADEAASVKKLGLTYHHIPILFDDPQTSQLIDFIELMDRHRTEKTLVHCAANYRASAFTGLYLLSKGEFDEPTMHAFIENVWQPDAVWEQFIEESVVLLKGDRLIGRWFGNNCSWSSWTTCIVYPWI